MRTFVRALLGFLGGLVVSYVIAVSVGFSIMSASNTFDRDGGMSMAIMFAIGPLAGIIGGIIAAIAAPVWLRRRDTASAAAGEVRKRWPPQRRAAVAAITWRVAVFFMARFVQWLFLDGQSFSSYASALIVAFTPHVLALTAAVIAALVVLRGAQRQTSS